MTGWGTIVHKIDLGTYDGWVVQVNNGTLYNYLNSGASGAVILLGTTDLRDDTWHHIAWVYDGSSAASGMEIFLDGIADSVVLEDNLTTGSTLNSMNVQIGGHTGWSEMFMGTIDDVRIWNVARSQAQIQANMNSTLTGSESGLVGYWNFDEDECEGTTATDSASGNTGILTNMDGTTDWVDSSTGAGITCPPPFIPVSANFSVGAGLAISLGALGGVAAGIRRRKLRISN